MKNRQSGLEQEALEIVMRERIFLHKTSPLHLMYCVFTAFTIFTLVPWSVKRPRCHTTTLAILLNSSKSYSDISMHTQLTHGELLHLRKPHGNQSRSLKEVQTEQVSIHSATLAEPERRPHADPPHQAMHGLRQSLKVRYILALFDLVLLDLLWLS